MAYLKVTFENFNIFLHFKVFQVLYPFYLIIIFFILCVFKYISYSVNCLRLRLVRDAIQLFDWLIDWLIDWLCFCVCFQTPCWDFGKLRGQYSMWPGRSCWLAVSLKMTIAVALHASVCWCVGVCEMSQSKCVVAGVGQVKCLNVTSAADNLSDLSVNVSHVASASKCSNACLITLPNGQLGQSLCLSLSLSLSLSLCHCLCLCLLLSVSLLLSAKFPPHSVI